MEIESKWLNKSLLKDKSCRLSLRKSSLSTFLNHLGSNGNFQILCLNWILFKSVILAGSHCPKVIWNHIKPYLVQFQTILSLKKTHSKAYAYIWRLLSLYALILSIFCKILIKIGKMVQNWYFNSIWIVEEETSSYSIHLSWYRLLNYAFNIR